MPLPPNGKCDPPLLCPDGRVMPPSGICVLGEIIERDRNPSTPDVVLGKRVTAASSPQAAVLPFTGGDLMPLTTLSLVLLFAGAAFVQRARAGRDLSVTPTKRAGDGPSAVVEMPSGRRQWIPLNRK